MLDQELTEALIKLERNKSASYDLPYRVLRELERQGYIELVAESYFVLTDLAKTWLRMWREV